MKGREESAEKILPELVQSLRQYTDSANGRDMVPTAIEGISILRSDRANRPALCLFKPALYLTLQGAKWATFGDKRYTFAVGQALMVAVDIPSRGTVTVASSKMPYLGLEIALDFAIMQEVAEEIQAGRTLSGKTEARGAFVLEVSRQILVCTLHAIRLLEYPEAVPILYPGIMREICYWLLTCPDGDRVRQMMIMANGHDRRIIQSVHTLRDKLREPIHVRDLVVAAHMSAATFHRQFKAVTGMTPVQYQKQLRLHEARRLMIFSNATVESGALEVGYASVSQFSREYSRLFGTSPRRDVSNWRRSRPVA
ncbi:AraC family transcriptional regulator [Granulicella sibirica]|uniref:Transcriptional regulator, AraC family n=1 Tax=Granulicella sibirica TaxID=2479048 RepID=A0A4Q0T1T8_9BACT|nr:AraC family transcriptional regulator [Granulicella sibirica]RXH57615.1 Transcriptional regulator, AraC family [Granulicella sibirica]